MSEEFGFYIYQVNANGKDCRYASVLPMNIVKEKGLVAEAIAGEVVASDESDLSAGFKPNPAFIRFLQWSIAQHVNECDAIIEEAKRVGSGNVMVPDFRKPDEDGSIAAEDVIGLVEVIDGKITKFHGSPDYTPFSNKGFMILDPFFKAHYDADLLAYMNKQSAQ